MILAQNLIDFLVVLSVGTLTLLVSDHLHVGDAGHVFHVLFGVQSV